MFHMARRRNARFSPAGEKPVAKPLGRFGIGDRLDRFGYLGDGPRYRRGTAKRFQSRRANSVDQDVHADGRQERLVHSFPMRYLFRFEVEHLLARCGFQVEHVYADFDKRSYGSTYPGELITVAKKV